MSDENQDICIYCSTTIHPCRGAGDHVIPAAFGRFRDDLRFRLICRQCNTLLGTAEETLLRSAPEALFRRFVQNAIKPTGRGKRGGGWSSAKGGERPKGTINHGDHTELVEMSRDNPQNVYPIDQLVVRDAAGIEHHLRLFPDMTAESLRRKIQGASSALDSRMYLHAEEQRYDLYKDLLAELCPDSPCDEVDSREADGHRIQGRTEFRFSPDYYRALAKIAFHYYLVVNRRGLRGDEPLFAAIRRFIMEGGDRGKFFDAGGAKFVSPFHELPDGGAMLSAVWAHALAADEEQGAATVNVMLFAGPMRLPPSHNVRVAVFSSPLVIPRAQTAHQYVYYGEPDNDGFSGFVCEASVNRI